ncbi:hypothetical protein BRADI_1g72530v3 [Brachypodium distachyon]|uniref:PDZ domain-containing protein n=1 Tax=Brachypodium distachyon TaxID=15368 RepID=I1H8Z8_BRADI|nr:hypothetical protein BRADI_1g72530v3 [Brachypodium distachyon]
MAEIQRRRPRRRLPRPLSGVGYKLSDSEWSYTEQSFNGTYKLPCQAWRADSLSNILTLGRGRVRVTKSVGSASSMDSMDGRCMILDVARSVVNVSATEADGNLLYSTSIIIEYDEVGKRAKILSSSSIMCTKEGNLRNPNQKVFVHLPKDTVVEAQVIFFNGHYGISLLDINTVLSLVPASLRSRPCYGQDVSVLDRHVDYSLVVGRGSIPCFEYPFFERNHCMFANYCSDRVCPNSTAEKIGIRRGDVIELIDLDHVSTVVELEEFLLGLDWDFLEKNLDFSSTIDIKIRVHDIWTKTSVSTIFPMGFNDAAVHSYY